jgi:uncharacterized protein
MSSDDDDAVTNVCDNPVFSEIVAQRLRAPSRRDVLRGGAGLGALGWMSGGISALLAACGDDGERLTPDAGADAPPAPPPDGPAVIDPGPLKFDAVAKGLADEVVVPAGYSFSVLYALGDPIAADVALFRNDGTDPAASFELRAGDHHDGMHYFGMGGTGGYDGSSDNGLLCINHEAITRELLHERGPTLVGGIRTDPDEIRRELFAHGVSIIEVVRTAGAWSYVKGSPYNRRIHASTEIEIAGPLRGNAAMVTRFSTDGTRTRGTVNNCANDYTPWGTYITCEENWNGYFRRDSAAGVDAKQIEALRRYGISLGPGRERWGTMTPDTADDLFGRWDMTVRGATAAEDYRNVANTFGWIVEIDPFTRAAAPRKRTALGRFAHEGAWPAHAVAGMPLVFYSGDDSQNEYIYKYVSTARWDPADANRADRLAVGDKYLDSGKLYVARFNADGNGEWIELAFGLNGISETTPGFAFADQADVILHLRKAADAVGATRMDRPEWITVNPVNGDVYTTLTNNSSRTVANTDPANPRFYRDPKVAGGPASGNPNGHIIRWKENPADVLAFTWDVYLFGANADADPTNVNLSGLDATNDFSSPDGLWFSEKSKILWIQTDDGAFTDVTNCMLLAAVPGAVGDGASRNVTSADGATFRAVKTEVGAKPGNRLKRFLVGPRECEITGLAETPDGTALFVNIQHPGEGGTPAALTSTWPAAMPGKRPRSATIVITRTGGGVIGL